MSSSTTGAAAVRRKIESLSTMLNLPTARRALGLMEGEHRTARRGGDDDPMSIRDYTAEDESRLIDWKASARNGRPMVLEREHLSTSRIYLMLNVGVSMNGTCENGETAGEVAANALCTFAALSARRHDEIHLVFADGVTIASKPFRGGLGTFERELDGRLDQGFTGSDNIAALFDYAKTLNDHGSIVVIATEEHELDSVEPTAIRRVAADHPLVVVSVSTLNPFRRHHLGAVTDGSSGRRVPAFLINEQSATAHDAHREYLARRLEGELKRNGARLIRAGSSQAMLSSFVTTLSKASNWGGTGLERNA
ncbi:Protein of unknown function DUF58 [Bifidobacterium bohemicum]|uniref:DUF58 domain-containing protein n=1 Tax=Bifidobacterium bohemicum DSM 22767 TaxID=1437606 RepID=A0A086ZFU1_9BIFI|nr:DUF58 domain-containing protein [Bifidobacterium bohemicum]KFI45391.1 hypothetical protein BBOH_1200 [Bifidobacterium bohemicum DSM 22767]SCB74012.1 Protein of unknown function DUF58 [Bifidobacterium bohemicum]